MYDEISPSSEKYYIPELEPAPEKKVSIFKDLIQFVIIVLVVILPIRLFIAQPFVVVGQSMEPTFGSNEYLIVDELSYKIESPDRGQVIVFKYPYGAEKNGDSKYFIKRIIGLPGETVKIKNGEVVIINKEFPEGMTLEEPYISSVTENNMTTTLRDDEYFVMGDNRPNSFDSRSWGALSESLIVGKAFLRLLPPQRISLFPGNHTEK